MKIKIFFLIFFAVFFEYLRDYLFVNVNLQIEYLEYTNNDLNVSNYTDSFLLKFFKNNSKLLSTIDFKELFVFII